MNVTIITLNIGTDRSSTLSIFYMCFICVSCQYECYHNNPKYWDGQVLYLKYLLYVFPVNMNVTIITLNIGTDRSSTLSIFYMCFICVSCQYGCYHNNPKYWDGQVRANSVDLDQTPRIAASDHGLHCLPSIQQFVDTSSDIKMA